MIKPELRKTLEDKLVIRATQKLSRHLTHTELITFFTKNRGRLENLQEQYQRDLNRTIREYLEGLK